MEHRLCPACRGHRAERVAGFAGHRAGVLRTPRRSRFRAGELAHLLGQLRVPPVLEAGPGQRRQRGRPASHVGLPDGRRAHRDVPGRSRWRHVRDRTAEHRLRAGCAHRKAAVDMVARDGVQRAQHRLPAGEPGRGDPGIDRVRGYVGRAPGGAGRKVRGRALGRGGCRQLNRLLPHAGAARPGREGDRGRLRGRSRGARLHRRLRPRDRRPPLAHLHDSGAGGAGKRNMGRERLGDGRGLDVADRLLRP